MLLGTFFISCKQKGTIDTTESIVKEWKGKKIVFPDDVYFTIQGSDTVSFSDWDKQYKILVYVDSVGCTSCKLKIEKWKKFIEYLEPIMGEKIGYLFFFHPQRFGIKTLKAELYANEFLTPVCFDSNDKLNKANNFSKESDFQTFLLDRDDRVLVVGNPINNSAIKELYLDILFNREATNRDATQISISNDKIDFGKIKQDSIVRSSVMLYNTGNSPFVFLGIDVSCRCVEVNYDKTPVLPNQKREVIIEYIPKEHGLISESVVIRGNTLNSVKLVISGEVIPSSE